LRSRHLVSSLVVRKTDSQDRIFISTDDFDSVGIFKDEAWDSEAIKSYLDTRECLAHRFPKADQTFIEALHIFIDLFLCIPAEKAKLAQGTRE